MALAVLASGCIHTGGGDRQESAKAITINSFSVVPQEIREGTSARVSLDLENTGQLPAEIRLGNKGQRVLKDYCPDIFSVSQEDFSVTTSGTKEAGSVTLQPGDRLNLMWQLRQQGDVPLIGYTCDVEVQLPFNYTVQTYRQVQIKKKREVQGSPELSWESSSGPMLFAIETVGSTVGKASTFIATEPGESRQLQVLLQLRNQRREDYNKGVVDVNEQSLHVSATSPLQLDESFGNMEKCDLQSSEDIRMFEGQSRVISCNLDLPQRSELDAPSQISRISAEVEYTYLQSVGSRTVRVKPRAN
ncbi:MAG: hypothetical protein ABEJ07_03795 [Candidatus Nanohaloarchaea archaeon]